MPNTIYDPADIPNPLPVSADSLPLPSGASTSAKQLPDGHGVSISQTIPKTSNGVQLLNSLVPDQYDNITLSYTGSNLTGAVYKLGVTTVATLTLAYDGSNNLTSVVKT